MLSLNNSAIGAIYLFSNKRHIVNILRKTSFDEKTLNWIDKHENRLQSVKINHETVGDIGILTGPY